jgi:hypothetical protein
VVIKPFESLDRLGSYGKGGIHLKGVNRCLEGFVAFGGWKEGEPQEAWRMQRFLRTDLRIFRALRGSIQTALR